uniref:(California timema) hypothetical protein n=1 Tax=Timema californicum TaxID=61474 RepID=A0A7R9IWT8_TIMCA|nr:unnamed protein product [Timema californicum]
MLRLFSHVRQFFGVLLTHYTCSQDSNTRHMSAQSEHFWIPLLEHVVTASSIACLELLFILAISVNRQAMDVMLVRKIQRLTESGGGAGEGYAEYIIVPDLQFLVKLPDSIPLSVAAMLPTGALLAMNTVSSVHQHFSSPSECKDLKRQPTSHAVVNLTCSGNGAMIPQLINKTRPTNRAVH